LSETPEAFLTGGFLFFLFSKVRFQPTGNSLRRIGTIYNFDYVVEPERNLY
jgi:hypothetical protein